MSYLDLHVSPVSVFTGNQHPFEKCKYTILGVPFDITSTFRSGARFGPLAIREASLNIEGYSFRSDIEIEKIKIHDLGDLHVSGDVELTLGRLSLVTKDIIDNEKIPIFIGGEHTITLGIAKSLDKNTALVSFDAHLDLRNNYLGLTVSHSTFMRRIKEEINPPKILEIGTRAVCKEELEYAKESRIDYIPCHRIRKEGIDKTTKAIKEILSSYEKVYVTIDLDVLDPAFLPAVPNPEPEGLDTTLLLDLLDVVCNNHIVGFDVVEITPHYDQGVTAIQATKIIFEMLGFLEAKQKI